MAVNLQKGQKISLEKEAGTGLSRVFMGLGWDVAKKGGFFGKLMGGDDEIDLDASCLMFNEEGIAVDAIWFGQLQSKDGSIRHSGDNRTGAGEGDDEVIHVDLARVPANIKNLVFTVNSFRGQTFDSVANAFCRLVDEATGKEVARFNLSSQGSHTGVLMAKVYRHNGEWKMHAIGETSNGRTFHDMMPEIRGIL